MPVRAEEEKLRMSPRDKDEERKMAGPTERTVLC